MPAIQPVPSVVRKADEAKAARASSTAPPAPAPKPARQESAKPAPRPAVQSPHPTRRHASSAAPDAPTPARREDPDAASRATTASTLQQTPLQADASDGDGASGQEGTAALADEHGRVAATAQALDCDVVAAMLPAGGDSGVFEVLFPDGERMGVAVLATRQQVSYLLSPASEALRSRLRRQQTELEDQLQRRIHKNVKIAVL